MICGQLKFVKIHTLKQCLKWTEGKVTRRLLLENNDTLEECRCGTSELELRVVCSSQYGGCFISAWAGSLLHTAGVVVGCVAGRREWTAERLVHFSTVAGHTQWQSVVGHRSVGLLHADRLPLVYKRTCHAVYTVRHHGNYLPALCACIFSILMVMIGQQEGIWTIKQEVKVIWQKAPHGGPFPRLGFTPGGRKLYHWIPGVGFPISVP